MQYLNHPLWQRYINPHTSKKLSIITLFLVLTFLPLSIFLSLQEQDIRQQAANAKKGKIVRAREEGARKSGKVSGVILVKLKASAEGTTAAIQTEEKITKKHKGKKKKKHKRTRWQEIEIPAGQEQQVIADLAKDPSVEKVEQDAYASILATTSDQYFAQQWGFQNNGQKVLNRKHESISGKIGADGKITTAWNKTQGSEDIVIAVLDTGIQADHPDLSGKVIKSEKIVTTSPSIGDVHGHGTHVAGIIAAKTNNATGVAGVCPNCKLVSIKVMSDQGAGKVSDIAAGIERAIELQVDVINLSIGSPVDLQVLEDAVKAAADAGIVVVAASGNAGRNESLFPAGYPETISVGATDINDKKPGYANYGATVDVAAPGDAILSTYTNNNYTIMNGTSQAAPMVSGLAGLLLATGEYGSAQEVRDRIERTTDKTGDEGTYWIHGRINAARALGTTESTPTPTIEPTPTGEPTEMPTKTPTKTPTIKPTTQPTGSITPTVKPTGKATTTPEPTHVTPTHDPTAVNITVNAYVVGIGKVGDRTRSGVPGNQSLYSTEREFTIEILGNGTTPLETETAMLTYSPSLGGYTGTIPVSDIPTGDYLVNIYSLGTLKKRVSGISHFSSGKTTRLPDVTLITGDINGDNTINILDFNILAGCYSDASPAKSCTATESEAADLNADGSVNGFDYNLLIRNLSVLGGS